MPVLLTQIMDMLGYEPSPWNKINIHVGGWVGPAMAWEGSRLAGARMLSGDHGHLR